MSNKICFNNISLRNLLDQNKNNRSEMYYPVSDEIEYNIQHADAREQH